MKKFAGWLGVTAALTLGTTPAALADDRPVSDEERAEIETVLETEGFTRWGELELDEDDGYFEVDDAVHEDGREYNLRLDTNYEIIWREID